ncbi:hypothetical protein FACS189487_05000 [Campylobacterota bacterium]|nr:hypothetical protein FACS189487_05000 [Campylobacterota bacterium]
MNNGILKNSLLFNELSGGDREAVFNISRGTKLDNEQILCYENDSIENVYFLLEGCIKSYKVNRFDNEIVLALQKDCGMITHYMPCDDDARYFSNVESVGESTIVSIEKRALDHLCENSKSLSEFLCGQFARKVAELKYIINRDLIYDGLAKVAFMISENLEDFNSMKRQDAAHILNIQPETLSRLLAKLKRDGLIEEKNTKILIKDERRLRDMHEI